MSHSYPILTPVKNEEKFLPILIESVVAQDVRPDRWIIINDFSTDRTWQIIEEASAEHEWIVGIDNEDPHPPRKRRVGGQAVFHLGLKEIQITDYDFIVRMDADISFEPSFLSKVFGEFDQNPRLGIASGVCYVEEKGELIEERHPRFHTRGPFKIYRTACFRAIGVIDGCRALLGRTPGRTSRSAAQRIERARGCPKIRFIRVQFDRC